MAGKDPGESYQARNPGACYPTKRKARAITRYVFNASKKYVRRRRVILLAVIIITAITASLTVNCEAGINQHLVSAKTYAKRLYMAQGASEKEWSCLSTLWTLESSWRVRATGSMTTQGRAYGIPQALPASKMERMGTDWKTNYQTQVRWGLLYIQLHWKNKACMALKNELNKGWY